MILVLLVLRRSGSLAQRSHMKIAMERRYCTSRKSTVVLLQDASRQNSSVGFEAPKIHSIIAFGKARAFHIFSLLSVYSHLESRLLFQRLRSSLAHKLVASLDHHGKLVRRDCGELLVGGEMWKVCLGSLFRAHWPFKCKFALDCPSWNGSAAVKPL